MSKYEVGEAMLNLSVECQACGEFHAHDHCPWEQTCAECSRTDVAMQAPRLCVDCHETNDRIARRERALDAYESCGDYRRDTAKDGAL
jgi:nitrate/TMAO reductase-like tetraheme cytochrome c subunit